MNETFSNRSIIVREKNGHDNSLYKNYHSSSDENESKSRQDLRDISILKNERDKSLLYNSGANYLERAETEEDTNYYKADNNNNNNNNNNYEKRYNSNNKSKRSNLVLNSSYSIPNTFEGETSFNLDNSRIDIENEEKNDLNASRISRSSKNLNKKYNSNKDLNKTLSVIDDDSPVLMVAPILTNEDKKNGSQSNDKNELNNSSTADLSIYNLLEKTSKKFILKSATIGLNIKCQIYRQNGLYPEYKFYVENLDGNLLLLMSARKKKKTKTTCYVISYISYDLDNLEKYIEVPVAKLKSNLIGTQFSLYDFGIKPSAISNSESGFVKQGLSSVNNELDYSESLSEENRISSDQNMQRKEYLSVLYDFNFLGLKGPRHMSVIIPGMDEKFNREDFVLQYQSDSLTNTWKKIEEQLKNNQKFSYPPNLGKGNKPNSKFSAIKRSIFRLKNDSNAKSNPIDNDNLSGELKNNKSSNISNSKSDLQSNLLNGKSPTELKNVVKLINKSPEWHKELRSFALNFNGRVTISSVKNFQIIHETNPEYVVMQFGKVNRDLYTCDYSYPMCALQAFGVALTSLDDKLACD